MPLDSDIQTVSEAAERWAILLARTPCADKADSFTSTLDAELRKHLASFDATWGTFAAVSDGIFQYNSVEGPEFCTSAHEAIAEVALLAVLDLLGTFNANNDPEKQRSEATRVWERLALSSAESSRLQALIRRERAKLLGSELRPPAKGWSEAKSPAQWRKELRMSETAMRMHIDAGRLMVDKITTKKWRFRTDTLQRFTGGK